MIGMDAHGFAHSGSAVVADMLMNGLMNLSVTTISIYCARILEKMQTKTNEELALSAIQRSLVE